MAAMGPVSPASGSGGPFAKTTAMTATPGHISVTIRREVALYRWGEDGIGGICDDQQRLCVSRWRLWNGKDPILKERMFGLTNAEGNHGEDPKEYYFYLDSTPTHSYMKFLYKYPQQAYPYDDIVKTNRHRGRDEHEYELIDTGVFKHGSWDVVMEYVKNEPDDILIQISATNRGEAAAKLHLLPTFWFRNTWSWADSMPKPQPAAHQTSLRGVLLLTRRIRNWGNEHCTLRRQSRIAVYRERNK